MHSDALKRSLFPESKRKRLGFTGAFAVGNSLWMDEPLDRPTAPTAKEPRFEEQVRRACRFRQFSIRTEEAYWGWAKQFILYHGKRHPRDMGEVEIRDFLTHLAAERNVAASTQNQALNALVFIYKSVLGRPAGDLTGIERASRPVKLPVVLSQPEVRARHRAVAPAIF